MSSKNVQLVYEVPSSLKQLARLVARGFYTLEDSLLIDMLVRNPCMKEDDLAELLRFEKKQIRSRISTLRNDKFVQVRLRMETGPDGKAQKVNYYFINYKVFVNVVKYKLDLMRKRMETEERDATSRASFICTSCCKTFTDLEADQLFDFNTHEFRCTFCGELVEEDSAALPKKDSRLMLAHFNDQLQPLYDLLREVEGIQLAPEILEPEPIDIDTIRGMAKGGSKYESGMWSGDATRGHGFAVEETRIDIHIDNDDKPEPQIKTRETPLWLAKSTVQQENDDTDTILNEAAQSSNNPAPVSNASNRNKKDTEDIMSVLLQHEKQKTLNNAFGSNNFNNSTNAASTDSSDQEQEFATMQMLDVNVDDENKEIDSDDEQDDIPTVVVGGRVYPINQISDELVQMMTPQERDQYIHVYQQHFSHIFD